MKIVLVSPQIPPNTGNVVRTCAATGTPLYLVRPLGFSVTDRALKRAGLDYWGGADVEIIDTLEPFLEVHAPNFYFFSSHAETLYTDVSYTENDLLIFGSETDGLPDFIFEQWPELCVKIPMKEGARCLNLATSVGIGLFEALRQTKR